MPKEMVKENYPLEYLNIDYNIGEIEKNVKTILDKVSVLNLEGCMFDLKTMLSYLDSLFIDFEKERLARKVYEEIEGYFSNGAYTFPIYLQGRGPWASQRFWGGTFATSACSVTAAAIIASGITGNTVLPSDIASAYTSITGSKPYPNFGYSNNLGPLVEYCGGKTLGRLSSFSEILNHLSQKILN